MAEPEMLASGEGYAERPTLLGTFRIQSPTSTLVGPFEI